MRFHDARYSATQEIWLPFYIRESTTLWWFTCKVFWDWIDIKFYQTNVEEATYHIVIPPYHFYSYAEFQGHNLDDFMAYLHGLNRDFLGWIPHWYRENQGGPITEIRLFKNSWYVDLPYGNADPVIDDIPDSM